MPMRATITLNKKPVTVDFSKPIDISIPVVSGDANPVAWYLNPPKIEPVVEGKWVAAVAQGAVVNFNNVVSAEPREIDKSSLGFS